MNLCVLAHINAKHPDTFCHHGPNSRFIVISNHFLQMSFLKINFKIIFDMICSILKQQKYYNDGYYFLYCYDGYY